MNEDTLTAIQGELAYQQRRWEDPSATIDEYVLYMVKYVLRCEEATNDKHTLDAVRKVAALAVACMDEHGAVHR